ncbi:MAG: murein biosynthesis integral membrane protein MurJ [Mycobacterium sp.]
MSAAGPPVPRRTTPATHPELTDAAVVSRSWGMALATLVSRITGFIRIVALAAILGAALSSAFSVANQLPNQIAALVLEATFTAIFVPVLARAERGDADGGVAFVRRLVTLATALLLLTTVISVAAAPLLVRLMLGRDPQVNEALTIAFAYLLLPQVICYGLSSVFMAILNNRNIFGPPAWAPVVNNVVSIATLVVYLMVPGELSVDPVRMGNSKLLVLGIGTTAGVVAQTAVLLMAIRRERISLRPLWGVDDRLKRFGAMAAAMVLYVLISQVGLVVTNQIASTSAASGPAIYYYAWLLLQLPFGMIGVTVLTVVMPRLSRNAAADDTPAVLADVSLATRLMMITLIPIVALMTVGGPAIGSALFAYGNFGDVDAAYLGTAVTLSAFTLIPYALVLLQLRVFYAREQPWTPIAVIVVITTVKIIASVLAPHLTSNPDQVAGYLGLANGLGFTAGAVVGHLLLRRTLRPRGGPLVSADVVHTSLVTVTAALLAALFAEVLDRLLGLATLTQHGGAGSMLRLLLLGLVMLPIIAAVLLSARVPEALAALAAVRRMAGSQQPDRPKQPSQGPNVPYAGHGNLLTSGYDPGGGPARHETPALIAGGWTQEGGPVTEEPSGGIASRGMSGAVAPAAPRGRPGGHSQVPGPDDVPLVPGLSVAGGRYRLLVFHGGTGLLQFWQALDTALDRQVALTFVDPDHTLPEADLTGILSRTQRLSQIDLRGIARVLDVARIGASGLVVSEWVRGASLPEVAGTSPLPIGAARAMRSLTAAAAAAHHSGVALSLDHPGRVRVSIDGDVTLAFPATLPGSNPEDDIRGIGAVLYALLVNRWPLPESGADCGLAAAERDAAGNPVSPDTVNPEIPVQIAVAAIHAIQPNGGIRGASTLSNLLQQATSVAEQTELLTPVDEGAPAVRPVRARASAPAPDTEAHAHRRRAVLIGAGVGGVVILAALLVLASVLNRLFGDVNGLDKAELGLNSPSTPSSQTADATPGSTVKPRQVTVFSPGGEADRPQDAGLAIDGNPATFWSTDTYHDPVPFPNFKSGVGLMLQLPKPTAVGAVIVNLAGTGTRVEIRSSSSAKPARLEDTKTLTQPKLLQPGTNRIAVDASSPTSNLLVWISTLGTISGENRAQISQITVQAAS